MKHKELKVLTLQLKKLNKKIHKKSNDQKYKWKLIPPKSGDASTKLMKENGVKKTYYWCTYHNQWTRHKPSECKKLPIKSKNKEDKNISRERQPTWKQKQLFKSYTSLLMRILIRIQVSLRILTLTPTHLTPQSISQMWTRTPLDYHRATMSCPQLYPC